MTLASATTARGSEIAQNLLLGHSTLFALRSDLVGQPDEDLAAYVGGELGRVPGQEKTGRPSFAGDEDHVVGAEHLARVISEVSYGYNAHVVTTVGRFYQKSGKSQAKVRRESVPCAS
jgi:hypothetical protein